VAPRGYLLDPNGRHALLSPGPRRQPARDLQRPGLLPGQTEPPGRGQSPNKSTLSYANSHRRPPSTEALFWETAEHFRKSTGLGRARAGSASRISCSRSIPPPSACAGAVPLGQLPPRQGRGQGPRAAGPRRLHALLHPDHEGPPARPQGGQPHPAQSRLHRGDGQGLQRLRAVRLLDSPGRLLRHPHEGQRDYVVVKGSARCRTHTQTSWPTRRSSGRRNKAKQKCPHTPCAGIVGFGTREKSVRLCS